MRNKRNHIHNSLRYHRKLWGYTLKEVAYLLGLSSIASVIHWEQGRELPNPENMLGLARIYRMPVELLFDEYRQELCVPIHEREKSLQTLRDQHHER